MLMTYISDDGEFIIGEEFNVETIIQSNGRNMEGSIIATIKDKEDKTDMLLEYKSIESFLNDWQPVRDGCGHVITRRKNNISFFPKKDDQ